MSATPSGTLLWVPFTIVAAFLQVFRNAQQSRLTARVGTAGGTSVRFTFGLPVGCLLLLGWIVATGETLQMPGLAGLAWMAGGALVQIAATALMLVVMARRDFGLAYAYIKTEPVSVSVLGLVIIGDSLPALAWIAIGIVTAGVMLASLRKGDSAKDLLDTRSLLVGVASGACFGLASIMFRAGIVAIPDGSFVMRSLTILVLSLGVQTLAMLAWFAAADRAGMIGTLREWRLSASAGFLGACASACWFIGFSLTAAANVRTLSLIEMPVVALVSRKVSGHWLARREWAGFVLITGGVLLLLFAHEG